MPFSEIGRMKLKLSREAMGKRALCEHKIKDNFLNIFRQKVEFDYERASAASERVHTELRENPEYERPTGLPAGRGDALQKLIS